MKSLFILAIALVSTSAFAARPNTNSMTCRDATALVQASGNAGVLLQTGLYTFDRYYAYGSVAAYVPTKDNALCLVGFVAGDAKDGPGVSLPQKHYGRSCSKEGVTQLVQGGWTQDGYFPETYRTCKNGQWFIHGPGVTKPDYVKARSCKVNGQRQLVQGGWDRDYGYVPEVYRVCVNGFWKIEK